MGMGLPLLVLLPALLVTACLPTQEQAGGEASDSGTLAIIPLQIGTHHLTAEVADTADLRARGLMFRESLPPDHGMLFVWEQPEPVAMWMLNTPLPLSVAFIDEEGQILNIARMQPHSRTLHHSTGAARYALEMRRGWFQDHGVQSGQTVTGLPR
ncbi:DUF192 domain-containing protein [Ectothiorhodospira lacustris]|uniref:DUF192 domain-containing protein n=1 Tax=Ectothiorhodospira lacustris TaxID=2899127 RepID=UPI001EE8CFA3|nr:DUF192 domain-containing protein [Ectothiorhodospira lacustris]MCG5509885.1 DUF192 domain-containing protein [Ectothiorhodospira lacustris]MCG5521138.1 DUF192 domain-containing protein [Ectothiorhodospira lacustris]